MSIYVRVLPDKTKSGIFYKIYVRGCILDFSPSLINHQFGYVDFDDTNNWEHMNTLDMSTIYTQLLG